MARHGDTRTYLQERDAAVAAAAAAAGPKSRRSHRKSRNGCVECKRRHIRCDEGRPACTNCTIAERTCSFPPGAAAASAGVPLTTSATPAPPIITTGPGAPSLEVPSPHHQGHSPAQSSSSFGSRGTGGSDDYPPRVPLPPVHPQQQAQSLPSFNESFAAAAPPAATAPPTPSPPRPSALGSTTFTPHHLILLHHVEVDMGSDILGHGQTSTVIDMAIRNAIDRPYLVDQLLAFSAMHLAYQVPEQAASFRHQATELQTRALSYFTRETETMRGIDTSASAPRFLFATLLSLHVLAETLAYHRTDFDLFIDSFIDCINLHRGVRFTARDQFRVLLQTELEPILALTQIQLPRDPRRGNECDPLAHLIDAAGPDLAPADAAACREVASLLQWAYDLSAQLPSQDIPHAVSGFIVVIPPEYVDVLRSRRPEALVILAYYGVLLHRTRRYWICGGNGAFVIRAVAQHLGPRWDHVMRWPLEVIEREKD